MENIDKIKKVYLETFHANMYTKKPFRMIGIIDVDIEVSENIERVTLAFFRSSGTNSGKIKGLWYPIVGIKLNNGEFNEFTPRLNFILSNTTRHGSAKTGWLAKSLFFANMYGKTFNIRGFSNGIYYYSFLKLGKTLRVLYESGMYIDMNELDSKLLNKIVTSNKMYSENKNTQCDNYEKIMEDIFIQDFRKYDYKSKL